MAPNLSYADFEILMISLFVRAVSGSLPITRTNTSRLFISFLTFKIVPIGAVRCNARYFLFPSVPSISSASPPSTISSPFLSDSEIRIDSADCPRSSDLEVVDRLFAAGVFFADDGEPTCDSGRVSNGGATDVALRSSVVGLSSFRCFSSLRDTVPPCSGCATNSDCPTLS